MKTIYKYILKPSCSFIIPKESKILFVQEQHGNACMWLLVDNTKPIEERKFKGYGTGHKMPDEPGEYIGSVLLENGSLVFHIFEEKLNSNQYAN